MSKICVLIRVYNRVEDLKDCVDIIRDTWKSFDYYIMIVTNGEGDGYIIDGDSKSKADKVINLTENVGHFNGNSQLLLDGLQHIPDECEYTIILEADTWLYGDELIKKYISQLAKKNAVWASAQFFRFIRNLATDFAIIKTSFIKAHPEIFKFEQTPEYFVANYLKQNAHKFIYINENMPVNLPRYIRKYPFAPTGRFFLFPAGKMVTHHIESLKNGMDEKKFYFNVAANKRYFDVPNIRPIYLTRALLKAWVALTAVIPYKSWFIKQKNN